MKNKTVILIFLTLVIFILSGFNFVKNSDNSRFCLYRRDSYGQNRAIACLEIVNKLGGWSLESE